MKQRLLYAAFCFAAATSLFASTRIIPVAGHLPGANGTSWTTDVSLTNNTASAVVIDLLFRPEDGIARSRSINLGANESTLLEDAVSPSKFPGTNPSAWIGQLEVHSTGDVSASAHIFTNGGAGGTFGSTYDDFDPSALSTSGSIAGLINSSHFRSNVAFANPNDQANGFDYVLRREDGSVAATRHVDVPGHSTRQLGIGSDVDVSPDDRRLSLAWTAGSGGYVIGSIVDNKSGDPTGAPSTSHDATTLSFPVVGKTAGSNSTVWSTSAAVTSKDDNAGSVTFVYTDNSSAQTYTKTSNIVARGTVRADDLNAFVDAPPGTGSLKVTATVNIVGAVRVFNTQPDGSTFGSAILPQSNVQASKVRIKGVRRDDDYRLNVAISNDESSATDGTVRLFDDRGHEVENEPFHLEHGKSVQVSMSRGPDKVHAGEIEVETQNGIPVTVVASNIDNRTGDTMQHESEQENERQNELEIEITPRTAAAGSPVAFSLRSAGANVAAVAWTFGDGTTATGLTATHTYTSAGEFEVNAQITLTGGAIVRAREDLHITAPGTGNPGPASIDFTYAPSAPAAGQEVVFTALGATSGGTFNWKFPGDVRKSGTVVTFTFVAAGSYEVELELEHEGSTTLHVTHVVIVGATSQTPGPGQNVTSIDFTWSPSAPKAGQTVSFTASFDRQPPTGSVIKWRFPDNSRPEGTNVTFTFATAGTYTVRAQIEQPGQASIEREKSVTVAAP
jgi:hypothetical protein